MEDGHGGWRMALVSPLKGSWGWARWGAGVKTRCYRTRMLMPALKWAASDDLRRVCLQVWVTVPRGQALSSSCSHQLPALGVGPLLFCSCALLRGDFGEDSRKQRCPQPASRWALGAGHRCASRFFQVTSLYFLYSGILKFLPCACELSCI